LEIASHRLRGLQRKPCFANATWACERKQAGLFQVALDRR